MTGSADELKPSLELQLALVDNKQTLERQSHLHKLEMERQSHVQELQMEKLNSKIEILALNTKVDQLEKKIVELEKQHQKDLEHVAELAALKAQLFAVEERDKVRAAQPASIVHIPSAAPISSIHGSTILQPHHPASLLQSWLGGGSWNMIFRASLHGFTAANFHAICDNRGATLVLVRSTGGFVFGGYASIPWNSSGTSAVAPGSFLFHLNNPSGDPPSMYPLQAPTNGSAMNNIASYGPSFGSRYDLYIADACQTNANYCNLGGSYTNTFGRGQAAFTGAYNFQVSDYEVFTRY